jgi:dTDP-4-dehydrorhamnose reductase
MNPSSGDKATKFLITGAGGMLGSALCPILEQANFDIIATDAIVQGNGKLIYLDVSDYSSVLNLVEKQKPDIIMHLAAETDVDLCEKNPDRAFKINTIGTQNITFACRKTNATMVYISTGAVFSGDKPEPYTEFDNPNPVNVYGKSKWEGEKIIENFLSKYYIVRAGWMIGGGLKDKKFVSKIVEQLEKTKKLKVVDDKFGSPTYAVDLSKGLIDLLKTDYYGVFHMANKGTCSRYELSREIVRVLGPKDVSIQPVSSALFPSAAPRPRSEALTNYKLDLLGMNCMRPWEEALEEYLRLNFLNG